MANFLAARLPAIILVSMISKSYALCPGQCVCSNGNLVVNCTNKQLSQLPLDMMDGITDLHFSGNLLPELGNNDLTRFRSLRHLDVSNNRITFVSSQAFDGLMGLQRILVQNNGIGEVLDGTFNGLGELVELNIGYNRIEALQDTLFTDTTKLSILKLEGNDFDDTVFATINTVGTLESVYLSNNKKLTTVPYLAVSELDVLDILYLRGCSITHLDSNAFIGANPSILSVDLSSNRITDLRREVFQPLTSMGVLDVTNNSLVCSCQTKRFQDWVKAVSPTLVPVTCKMPESGDDIDIEFGDFSSLCQQISSTSTIEPPADNICGANATLEFIVVKVSDNTVTVNWTTSEVQLDAELQITAWEIGFRDQAWNNRSSVGSRGFMVTGLAQDSAFVVCGQVVGCNLGECVDVQTMATVVAATPNVLFGVIGGLAGICLIIILVLIVVVVKRRTATPSEQAPKHPEVTVGYHHQQQDNGTHSRTKKYSRPEHVAITANGGRTDSTQIILPDQYDAYEAIPDDKIRTSDSHASIQSYDNRSFDIDLNQPNGYPRSMAASTSYLDTVKYEQFRRRVMENPSLLKDEYLQAAITCSWSAMQQPARPTPIVVDHFGDRREMQKAKSMNDMLDPLFYKDEQDPSNRPNSVGTQDRSPRPKRFVKVNKPSPNQAVDSPNIPPKRSMHSLGGSMDTPQNVHTRSQENLSTPGPALPERPATNIHVPHPRIASTNSEMLYYEIDDTNNGMRV